METEVAWQGLCPCFAGTEVTNIRCTEKCAVQLQTSEETMEFSGSRKNKLLDEGKDTETKDEKKMEMEKNGVIGVLI